MTAIASLVVVVVLGRYGRPPAVSTSCDGPNERRRTAPTLEDAQRSFYSGRYEDAAQLSGSLCSAGADDLEACELRTSSLHFQIRRAMGDVCRQGTRLDDVRGLPRSDVGVRRGYRSRAHARTRAGSSGIPTTMRPCSCWARSISITSGCNWERVDARPVGTSIGKRENRWTQVLKRNPSHLRARVARAWIDYIVGTKMPRGTRWVLGGGSKKKGLRVVREAASAEGDFFERAEATFALWDMQVRERDLAEAVVTAEQLARDFPDNRELARFLSAHRGSK